MKLNPDLIEYIKTNVIIEIDLIATAQDDKNIKNFADVLKDHCYINSLEFAESQINDDQLYILSEAISQNTSLCFIDLSMNPITEKGIEYLAKALEKNTSVQVINLSYIELTPKSIELLNKIAFKSPSITRIIPDEIITQETKQIIFYKNACKTILELIERSSEESSAVLLEKVCEIAKEHYQEPLTETARNHSLGVFS